jgi:hypothetical protein
MAALTYYLAPFTWPGGPLHAAICLAAALAVAGAGIVADRIWDATAAPALGIAYPAPATLARYPFRLLAGGIAVTVVMLAAKRADLLWVADVPVKNIFATGAALAAFYHVVRDTRLRRWSDPRAAAPERKERTDQ